MMQCVLNKETAVLLLSSIWQKATVSLVLENDWVLKNCTCVKIQGTFTIIKYLNVILLLPLLNYNEGNIATVTPLHLLDIYSYQLLYKLRFYLQNIW